MEPITKAAFAAELGVTKGRVSQYIKNGMPVRDDGKIDRVEALNWLNSKRLNLTPGVKGLNRAAAIVRPREESDKTTDFEAERTRKLKLGNDATEKKMIPDEIIDAAFDLLFGPFIVELASLPAQVTDDVVIRRRIEDVVDALRNRHADRLEKAMADIRGGRDPFSGALGIDSDEEPHED